MDYYLSKYFLEKLDINIKNNFFEYFLILRHLDFLFILKKFS